MTDLIQRTIPPMKQALKDAEKAKKGKAGKGGEA